MLVYTRNFLLAMKKCWKSTSTYTGHGLIHRSLSRQVWLTLKNLNLLAPRRGQRGRNHLRRPNGKPITVVHRVQHQQILSKKRDGANKCNLLNIQIHAFAARTSYHNNNSQESLTDTGDLAQSESFCSPKRANLHNLVNIPRCQKTRWSFPSVLLCNARSLFPKIDELRASLMFHPTDFVAITESWLHADLPDSAITVDGYEIYRNDRTDRRGGGVAAFVNSSVPSKRLFNLENSDFECLWLKLRPRRLPRSVTSIYFAVVYNPPNSPIQNDLIYYLIDTIDSIRSSNPDCGIFVLGDFNNLDTSDLCNNQHLVQVVDKPTRGVNILDLCFTNLAQFYLPPECNAPLGSSDHSTVLLRPNHRYTPKAFPSTTKKISLRRMPESAICAFGRWISRQDWVDVLSHSSISDCVVAFTAKLNSAVDIFFPSKKVKLHSNDKPWMSPHVKDLIYQRQQAFSSGDVNLWRHLRNKVARSIASCKQSFYCNQVSRLKLSDPSRWWNHIKRLHGQSSSSNGFTITHDESVISESDLPNFLNLFFVSIADGFTPLDYSTLPAFFPAVEKLPVVSIYEIKSKLANIKASKSAGPDAIHNRILKEFAFELAYPVAEIFNRSFASGVFPDSWKQSFISPIPKTRPVQSENDLRPISLTPTLSKIQEDFAVRWLFQDIGNKIDIRQFGSLKGSSTSLCLIDLLHCWLKSLDQPGRYIQACFLDFSKAFDRIDHNILVRKLFNLGVRPALISWICSFLTQRKQAVKLNGVISSWLPTTAGVPQGTKLGPILFLLMLNDLGLSTQLNCNYWKYVDDITLSEAPLRGQLPCLQQDLDKIYQWATDNNMLLNPKKCKVMTICYFREKPVLPVFTINGTELDSVLSHKVLGLTLQSDLRWNVHIESIISKACKRLYILRVLRRSGVSVTDLTTVYVTLIRSLLEYGCLVWHSSLPACLSDKLEYIQKRALRIILPKSAYTLALETLNLSSLFSRREGLCNKGFSSFVNFENPRFMSLLPPRRRDTNSRLTSLRCSSRFTLPNARTERFKRSFIPSMFFKQ